MEAGVPENAPADSDGAGEGPVWVAALALHRLTAGALATM